MAELTTDILNKLKIWWNIAYKNGNTEVYNKCSEVCEGIVGKFIEVNRYRKFAKSLDDLKLNDLAYIPEHYLDSNGILDKYYTKDDIVRICRDNKVVAKHIYKRLKGELVEDMINDVLQEYYEWLMKEETSSLYRSPLSVNVVRIMDKDKQEEVYNKFDKRKVDKI